MCTIILLVPWRRGRARRRQQCALSVCHCSQQAWQGGQPPTLTAWLRRVRPVRGTGASALVGRLPLRCLLCCAVPRVEAALTCMAALPAASQAAHGGESAAPGHRPPRRYALLGRRQGVCRCARHRAGGQGLEWVRGWGWQCDGTAVTAKRRLPATMSTARVGRSVPQALLPPDWMPSAEPAFHRIPPLSRWRAALAPPADGSLGSRTALLHQPYADQPGSGGTRTIALETLRQLVAGADAAGLQVGAPLLQAVSSAVHPVHPCAGHMRHSRFLAGPE